jgi:hypothetical protein
LKRVAPTHAERDITTRATRNATPGYTAIIVIAAF